MAAVNKSKFIDLKKILKEEPGGNVRLQSLKKPRDLNLGLLKQPKKVFVPNLNVVRNKEKSKEFNKRDEKGKDRVRDRKQKPRDNATRFIQSSGVFSEGVGSDIVSSSRWAGARGDKENDSAPAMSMPTIKKNSFQVDKKNEDSVLSKITDCDDDSDDEKLPFKPISWQNNQKPMFIKNEINSNIVKIKEEIPDEDDVTPNLKKLKLEPNEHDGYNDINLIASEFIKEENLNSDCPSISLWALPDSFAGKGLSDDPNCKKLFDYGLNDMHEGQVGKIVIRKSGRMEIHIGSMKYELEPGESNSSYKEDIVCLDNKTSKNKAIAATLGNIKNRLFLSPDWDRLLL